MSRNSARLAVAELVVDTIDSDAHGIFVDFLRKKMTAILQLPGACSSWPCWGNLWWHCPGKFGHSLVSGMYWSLRGV